MNRRKDQDYPFIKETIKKRPMDTQATLRRLILAVVCGVVFGLCAALTLALCMPGIIKEFEKNTQKQGTVQLSPPTDELTVTGAPETEEDVSNTGKSTASDQTEDNLVTVEEIQDFYRILQGIAEKPQKALVRVAGMTGDSDLLNDSVLTYGDEGGIVFFKNEEGFYILTTSARLEEMDTFRVTFSNGDTGVGTLCGADERTRIVVIYVPGKTVQDFTMENIPAVALSTEISQERAQPVIAIGSPVGDMDSLIYGSITSMSGRLNIADDEYSLITTDIAAAENGGGVLLDMQGRMTGLIIADEEEKDNSVVRAVSVAQLRPMFEKMINGEGIRYAGIIGTTISRKQAGSLEIPQGVYVERVEADSPAMAAGIQSGDIIHRLDGTEIESMWDYSMHLQEKKPGSDMEITLYRKNATGAYVDVELNIIIKEQ